MIATIHQPDFMPWLGFFNKINKADTWVILDHVTNNPRDAAFWGRRVKILVNSQEHWLSLPLEKEKDSKNIGIPINDMKYNFKNQKAFITATKTIEYSYKKAPFFKEIFPIAEKFMVSDEQYLVKRNLQFIFDVMNILNIKTKIVYSSSLNCSEKSTKLLIEILKKINADSYLCGGGAKNYQDDELIQKNGIEIIHNNFIYPSYHQYNSKTFVPGLSILDVLMSIGIDETRNLIY